MFLSDLKAQGEKDFSLGSQAAAFAPFNPVDGQGRDPRHSRQLRLAQHFVLANLFYVVSMLHPLTFPSNIRVAPKQLLSNSQYLIVNLEQLNIIKFNYI